MVFRKKKRDLNIKQGKINGKFLNNVFSGRTLTKVEEKPKGMYALWFDSRVLLMVDPEMIAIGSEEEISKNGK